MDEQPDKTNIKQATPHTADTGRTRFEIALLDIVGQPLKSNWQWAPTPRGDFASISRYQGILLSACYVGCCIGAHGCPAATSNSSAME
jgi:hypothetical protein